MTYLFILIAITLQADDVSVMNKMLEEQKNRYIIRHKEDTNKMELFIKPEPKQIIMYSNNPNEPQGKERLKETK